VKVKARPADFVVQEESSVVFSLQRTDYAVFRLLKSSWDTFDLIDYLARRWGVHGDDISVGGMKDRHGSTEQLISVRGLAGRPQSVSEKNFTLNFEGWTERPLTARDIRGNRFTITLRDLLPREVEIIAANAPEVARDGIPNYFDEQRFGSARHGAGFMGKEIFLGRREKALRLFFTPSKHDDQKTRKLKRCITEHWGRWEDCAGMGFGEYGRILAYLASHRGAYHQALERIEKRFLVFVLNAYQSFLFNEILARWIGETATERGISLTSVRYSRGTFLFPRGLSADAAEALRAQQLPVPGHDTVCGNEQVQRILDAVLSEEGIALSDLKVRQMRRIRVGGVQRAALSIPEDLEVRAAEPDDLYPGKLKSSLRFFLPRGSYATLLIKRLCLPPAR
jgi:tRNA pseudouridine13 synthase